MRIAKFDRIRSHTHHAADRLDKIAYRLADVPQEVEQGGNLDHFEQLEVNVDDLYAALLDADAVVLMTEWNVYRGMDLGRARRAMHGDVFVDLRNVYEPDMMREHGFQYIGVGR